MKNHILLSTIRIKLAVILSFFLLTETFSQETITPTPEWREWDFSFGMYLSLSGGSHRLKNHLEEARFGDDNLSFLNFFGTGDYPRSSTIPIALDMTLRRHFTKNQALALMVGLGRTDEVEGFRRTGGFLFIAPSKGIIVNMEHKMIYFAPMYSIHSSDGQFDLQIGPTAESHSLTTSWGKLKKTKSSQVNIGFICSLSIKMAKWLNWVNAFHYSPDQKFLPSRYSDTIKLKEKVVNFSNYQTGFRFLF